jgi:hypothetical protein
MREVGHSNGGQARRRRSATTAVFLGWEPRSGSARRRRSGMARRWSSAAAVGSKRRGNPGHRKPAA